jgi:hypothetical protein
LELVIRLSGLSILRRLAISLSTHLDVWLLLRISFKWFLGASSLIYIENIIFRDRRVSLKAYPEF